MFSFHKPKIYRSNLGCCICKAKSSSSRFTDSKKYENEFERCFRIQEKRSGEICNACVLLVKRWKKLSPENRLTKHWHHVVDARAGPGTKLTGNRRITSNNSSHHQNDSSGSTTQSSRSQKSSQSYKTDALPLSSSNQTNNQSSSSSSFSNTRGRASSLSKARAIDTNVSTFTFGEPPSSAYRRNFFSNESSSSYSIVSCSPFTKPQSALNSNAFELVIKRFRQRQQQQHLEAQRRLVNRQERLRLRQLNHDKKSVRAETSSVNHDDIKQSKSSLSQARRVKRVSENYSSLASLEALKVSSVLDSSIWRKEKICCGIIFRGLHNEVAIFPKLLRPCECRLPRVSTHPKSEMIAGESLAPEEELDAEDKESKSRKYREPNSPQPRTVKSGSISSCHSSTSGTGSMEHTLEEIKPNNRDKNDTDSTVRPRSVPSKRRVQQKQKDDIESNSISDASTSSSGVKECSADSPTESDHSSARMALIDGCDVEDLEYEDDEDVDDEDADVDEIVHEDGSESSNDASTSVESLIGMDRKKSSAVA